MQFLAAINAEIERRKLKQVELAQMIGIRNSEICSFISGGRTISSDKLIRLLEVLEIKLMKKEETIEDVIVRIKYTDLVQRKTH
ncbi:hypothetical protein EZS27_011989 [termite gut metagenome]|uniref:HTH cro/C1-type domain-containing protein n=1 Tax=termite gut metagenome TaxID=433724 RepID=A0A5J4S1S2_9ZZZZ